MSRTEHFQLVDADGAGVLKTDQIELVMRALGYNPAPGEFASTANTSDNSERLRHSCLRLTALPALPGQLRFGLSAASPGPSLAL